MQRESLRYALNRCLGVGLERLQRYQQQLLVRPKFFVIEIQPPTLNWRRPPRHPSTPTPLLPKQLYLGNGRFPARHQIAHFLYLRQTYLSLRQKLFVHDRMPDLASISTQQLSLPSWSTQVLASEKAYASLGLITISDAWQPTPWFHRLHIAFLDYAKKALA